MKRYNIFGPPGCVDAKESPTGEWVQWEDIEQLKSELERLIEENKWLRKEKDEMIQYERDKQSQLYKAAEKLGFWEDLEKVRSKSK